MLLRYDDIKMKQPLIFIGLTVCLLTFFVGCTDKDLPVSHPDSEGTTGLANITFQLNVALGGENGMTRAMSDSTIGHSIETTISTLHLFVVPLTGGSENWEAMEYGIARLGNTYQNPVCVTMKGVSFRQMRVYVGANMSEEQVMAFRQSKDEYEIPKDGALQYYYGAINQFAPFPVEGMERDPKNIVMFARDVFSVDLDNMTQKNSDDRINLGTVYLKRIVAKILVTCEVNETDVNYVKITGDLEHENEPKGWTRQEEVYYFVNNMPRRTKYLQVYQDKNSDGIKETLVPNYNLKETLDNLATKFSPLKFDVTEIKKKYIHYDQLELYNHNQSFQKSVIWNQNEYDKLINNKESTYNKENTGMYTLENVFGIKDGDFTDVQLAQLKNYEALPILTHVSIAAKFTPRFIFVTNEEWNGEGEDDKSAMKKQTLADGSVLEAKVKKIKEYDGNYLYLICEDEEAAKKILTYSLEKHEHLTKEDYDPDKKYMYPAETYFAYWGTDEAYFCSYGAASKGNKEGHNWPEMIPYTGGWNYYYTYINNEREGPVTSIGQSCIERNCYYILRVNSIGSLGSSISDPRYIKVHTLKSGWQYGGEGETTLH